MSPEDIKKYFLKFNWKEKGKEKIKNLVLVLRILLVLLLESLAIVLITQKFQVNQTNAALIWAVEHKRIVMVTSMIIALFGVTLDVIIGRFWIANTIFLIIGVTFMYANQQKMLARDAPLLPSDLIFIKEPTEMMKMANQNSLLKVILGLIVLVVVTILLEKIFPIKWSNLAKSWILRLIIASGAIFVFSGIFSLTNPGTRAKQVSDWMGNKQEFWNPASSAIKNGTFLTFANYWGSKIMNEPTGYSKETMGKIVKKYQKRAEKINRERKNGNINKQTLIYVLSESYSDPRRVPGIEINKNPMPEIEQIKKQNTSGLMLSSGYGGGTANIEYGAETSWSLQSFSPSLTTPFSQLVIRKDYNPNVTNLFKRKHAIHPYLGTFYERRQAYEKFGFQTFRTIDGKKANQKLKYQKRIQKSNYVGDDEAYKNVYWQLNHEKRGQFINLATMQNHLGYGDKYNQYDYSVSGSSVTDINNKTEIYRYTEGLSLTSKFTKKFLNKLDTYQRPITVVWYGDHLPGIYQGVNMSKNYVTLHETDYFVFSNKYARTHGYSIGKQTQDVNVVSPNNFTALALKQMNQKVNPFYAMMTEVLEKLPAQSIGNQASSAGLFVNNNSESVSSNSFTKKQKELLQDYKLVQYDSTAGKHYLKNKHFMR